MSPTRLPVEECEVCGGSGMKPLDEFDAGTCMTYVVCDCEGS